MEKQPNQSANCINVLDSGFVRLVEHMGSDDAIVQAARVSYGHGTKTTREDKGLIDYLMRHQHTSPFEQVIFKFHIKMPIFVARQWVRHRTASMNEISGRYSELPETFYVPELFRFQPQSSQNKQGSEEGELTVENTVWKSEDPNTEAKDLPECMRSDMEVEGAAAFTNYNNYLTANLSREVARINLPLSTYTEFYWTMDLHNLMHMLKLRLDSHAQYETRKFAEAVANLVKVWVPYTWESFENHILNGSNFAKDEIDIIKKLLPELLTTDNETFGNMTKNRRTEFLKKLGLTS